jgi:hypothetical protein
MQRLLQTHFYCSSACTALPASGIFAIRKNPKNIAAQVLRLFADSKHQ